MSNGYGISMDPRGDMLKLLKRACFPELTNPNSALSDIELAKQSGQFAQLALRLESLDDVELASFVRRAMEPPQEIKNTIELSSAIKWLDNDALDHLAKINLVFGIEPWVDFEYFPIETELEYRSLAENQDFQYFFSDHCRRCPNQISPLDGALEKLFDKRLYVAQTTIEAWKSLRESKEAQQVENPFLHSPVESRQPSRSGAGDSVGESPAAFIDSGSLDPAVNAKVIAILEKMILGMAIEQYGYDPREKKSSAITDILDDLLRHGIRVDNSTIRTGLREAYDNHSDSVVLD